MPGSIWAMIAKLRIWLSGVGIGFPWAGPEHKDGAAPDQREGFGVIKTPASKRSNPLFLIRSGAVAPTDS